MLTVNIDITAFYIHETIIIANTAKIKRSQITNGKHYMCIPCVYYTMSQDPQCARFSRVFTCPHIA